MRLSTKERDILACIQLRADLPIETIRKETGYRDHTIRYAIRSMETRGIIKRIPFVNVCAAGYTMHNIFFSIGSENKKLKSAISKVLMDTPSVLWVAEMGADFQYGIGMCTKQVRDVKVFLNDLSERFGNVFFEKIISSQFAAFIIPRGYLSSKKFPLEPLVIAHTEHSVEIDELDHKILLAICADGAKSHRALSQELRMPLSTLELRVRKLREKGVIGGAMYGVNASLIGMQNFKLLVYGKGVSPELTKHLYKFSLTHPAVTYFIECFGSWDYEIGVEVSHPQEVVGITQELYEQAGLEIQTVKALSIFRDVKLDTYPALRAA